MSRIHSESFNMTFEVTIILKKNFHKGDGCLRKISLNGSAYIKSYVFLVFGSACVIK